MNSTIHSNTVGIKKRNFLFSIMILLLFCSAVFAQSPAKQVYQNPIIPGFNPDPSICRVGNDYYLATSSFEYFPGVPIYHSLDLVHWKMIGHALNRPTQLNLDSINCSGGIYAPTLRYNNGTFYMITTLVGAKKGEPKGNFIVTAQKPEGPWSDPHWIADAPGIDPSLFFDDNGKVYYSGNDSPAIKLWDKHRNIWVQELDLKTWKLIGKRVDVVDGGEYYKKGTLDGGIESGVNNYEGSHLYKKDGTYYLLLSHGGTSQNHAVSIWKSSNVFGPYTINPSDPILTHRDLPKDHAFTSTGHADLVQTQNNEWWIVYLAKRPYGGENHILGRETFMSPVDWSGTWPVVNPKGEIRRGETEHALPNLPKNQISFLSPKDDFESKTLQNQWTFIRTPRTQWWSLNEKSGFLRIHLRPETIANQANPSFIGKRQEQPNFSASLKMIFKPLNNKEEAGFVVERDKDHYFKFALGMDKSQSVLRLAQKSSIESKDSLLSSTVLKSNTLYLKITADGVYYNFFWSVNAIDWNVLKNKVDGRFLGLADAGRFTGTFIGMYASSNGSASKNYVDFDWLEYSGNQNTKTKNL